MEDSLSGRILEQYRDVDRAAAAFAASAGLACPAGCGRCCENPAIQATELEMIPAAMHVLGKERIDTLGDLSRATCVFFEPGAAPGQGRCSLYEMRPLVCRLFGFAARSNKTGGAELAVCRVHRAESPEAVKRALQAEETAPRFQTEFARLANLDPGSGWELLPINTALKRALERVHLQRLKSDR